MDLSSAGPALSWLAAFALAIVLAMTATSAHAAPPTSAAQRGVVEALESSGRAWTAGDLDGFMAVYEQSPATTYLGHGAVVRGYDAIRATYAPRFAPGANQYRILSFDVLETRMLGTGYVLATGRYHLRKQVGDTEELTGLFTLVFHKGSKGWRIISDHTG
jgi:ketosteroid isomerase-like protein